MKEFRRCLTNYERSRYSRHHRDNSNYSRGICSEKIANTFLQHRSRRACSYGLECSVPKYCNKLLECTACLFRRYFWFHNCYFTPFSTSCFLELQELSRNNREIIINSQIASHKYETAFFTTVCCSYSMYNFNNNFNLGYHW